MILSVKDRVLIPGIFAQNKDSLTEAAVQRSIRGVVSIGDDEAKAMGFQPANGGYIWDARKGIDKEIVFDAVQLNYLKESIYTLSRAGGITQALLPLCEKINAL